MVTRFFSRSKLNAKFEVWSKERSAGFEIDGRAGRIGREIQSSSSGGGGGREAIERTGGKVFLRRWQTSRSTTRGGKGVA